MRIMFKFIVIGFFIAMSTQVLAVDTYVFDDAVMEKRYQSLTKDLRCPKCQNQNLADSNAPIATDLRREVYELLQQGKSDGEIVDFMVKRYGDFVLYRPKVSSLTYILWFGPAILLLIGVVIVVMILRRKPAKQATQSLSSDQQDKLAQILKDK